MPLTIQNGNNGFGPTIDPELYKQLLNAENDAQHSPQARDVSYDPSSEGDRDQYRSQTGSNTGTNPYGDVAQTVTLGHSRHAIEALTPAQIAALTNAQVQSLTDGQIVVHPAYGTLSSACEVWLRAA